MKSVLVGSIVAITIFVSFTLTGLVSTYLIGPCDAKFGCWGGVLFGMMVAAAAGSVAFIALIIVHRIFVNRYKKIPAILPSIISGLVLSALLHSVFYWLLEPIGMVLAWVVVCVVIFFAIFELFKAHSSNRNASNNQL